MRTVSTFVCPLACLVAATTIGCSEPATHGNDVSSVSGALATATFPSAPSAVEATDEAGAVSRTAPNAHGAFVLPLTKDHTYRVAIVTATGSEPLVFPRASGKLDTTFKIGTGAAKFDLGTIRHLDSAPATGFKHAQGKDAGEDGECVDGTLEGTGEACVDDDEEVTCEGARAAEAPDGECENGKDVATGAACVDDDDAEPGADGSKALCVAENNIPPEVGGCEDGAKDGAKDGEDPND